MTSNITLITSNKPPILTKQFKLSDKGELVKIPAGNVFQGTAERLNISDLDALATLITGLKSNQALTYGTPGHEKARIVIDKNLAAEKAKSNGGLPVIARDRGHFSYPEGIGCLMLDIDPAPGTPDRTAEEIRQMLISICPEMATAPMLLKPSVSSCLYKGKEKITGCTGWRVWILISDARDISRAGNALFQRSWLTGLGYIKISESGGMLTRGALDACVYQPERLDFAAPAVCEPPLEQHRPEPILYNKDVVPFDTRLIKNLSPAEISTFEKLIATAKQEASADAKAQRDRWIEKRINEKLSEHPEATEEQKQHIRDTYTQAAARYILHANFEIQLIDGDTVTVEQLLDNKEKYHLKYCKDPLEPGGENSRARLHLLNAGKAYIWSFYQGARFVLSRTRNEFQIMAGERVRLVEELLNTATLDACLYMRGGEVITINDSGNILPLNADSLGFYLDGLVKFFKHDTRAKKMRPTDCPKEYVSGFACLARQRAALPELKGVINHPILDPETGRVIACDGFDRGTGLLIRLDGTEWPSIPEKSTKDLCFKASQEIFRPFMKMPFAEGVDLGVLISTILTAIIRPLLPTAPGTLFTAPAAGTGKTLSALSISALAGVTYPSVFPFDEGSGNDSEMRKRLLSIFRKGIRVCLFDNVTGTFESSSFCAALTSPIYEDRLLSANITISAPTNTLFLITGNNIRLKGDACRRVLSCRLDARHETPWKRVFDFDPVENVIQHRAELVTNALTLLKGAMQSGYSLPDSTGSFKQWNDTARKTVCWMRDEGFLQCDDPIKSIDEAFENDPETAKLRAFLAAWTDALIGVASVADVVNLARDGCHQELFDACFEIAGEGRDIINTRRLGRWIERQRGRIIDGLHFEIASRASGQIQWTVK
jgi:hypothetical protein